MPECRCPECGKKMVDIPHVPSALDDVACPKCRAHYGAIGFWIPVSLGACVVDCCCDRCGHKWSVHVVLPKNFLG